MRSDALSNLAKIGMIKAEPMNRSEIDRILTMARKRLEESAITELIMLAEKMISDVDQLIGK